MSSLIEDFWVAFDRNFAAQNRVPPLVGDALYVLAERLDSPHADKVYLAKGYTKADLRRDLLRLANGPT